MNDLGMMEIPLAPGDREVTVRYEGVSLMDVVIAAVVAAVVLGCVVLLLWRRRVEVRVNAAT